MTLPVPPPDSDRDDWRLQATSQLTRDWTNPASGKVVPKGTSVTVISPIQLTKKKRLTIPLPNATALLLDASANAFTSARNIRDSNGIDSPSLQVVSFSSTKDAFDYLERMTESIVLAYTALEAFVNETIPADFEYVHKVRDAKILTIANKANIERHISMAEKLTFVLPEVLKCSSPKKSSCWQKYLRLKETRDRIIHMKTEDRKSTGPDVDTLWRAIFVAPAPHLTVMDVIDHFVRARQNKPRWYLKFPHRGA